MLEENGFEVLLVNANQALENEKTPSVRALYDALGRDIEHYMRSNV